MERRIIDYLYLMSITTVLVIGLLFIITGVKNINGAPKIADRIAPSKVYENYGFSTIESWQAAFEKKNKNRIFIGIGLIVVTAGVVGIKKSLNKRR